METKWLKFKIKKCKPKTKVYSVLSKCDDVEIGEIKWYPAWHHYCFFPTTIIETVHSDRCLREISDFVEYLNKKHKGIITKIFDELMEEQVVSADGYDSYIKLKEKWCGD